MEGVLTGSEIGWSMGRTGGSAHRAGGPARAAAAVEHPDLGLVAVGPGCHRPEATSAERIAVGQDLIRLINSRTWSGWGMPLTWIPTSAGAELEILIDPTPRSRWSGPWWIRM